MKNKKEKTNIDYLRDILSKYELEDTTEAMEFLKAIEEEKTELMDTVRNLREDLKNCEDDDDLEEEDEKEARYDNADFVGLDTISWKLDNGNLVIQQKMEYFIEALQKQNAVVPA